jgi:hypothetical protein
MNAEEFIEGIQINVYKSAIKGVVKNLSDPPGRKPRKDLVELSTWFNQLTDEDREQVAGAVRLAAYQATFGMMAVLDGVRVIDDRQTEFYLRTDTGILLNEDHDLHELFQIAVDHQLGYVDQQGNVIDG